MTCLCVRAASWTHDSLQIAVDVLPSEHCVRDMVVCILLFLVGNFQDLEDNCSIRAAVDLVTVQDGVLQHRSAPTKTLVICSPSVVIQCLELMDYSVAQQ